MGYEQSQVLGQPMADLVAPARREMLQEMFHATLSGQHVDNADLQILRGEHPAKEIRPPLLVLLDLNMPRMDGLDFLDHLRADPELHTTVVFVFTTSNLDLDRDASYAKHIAGYIVKSDVGPQYSKLAELFISYGKSITLPQY